MTLLLVDGTNLIMRHASVMTGKDTIDTATPEAMQERDRVCRAASRAIVECGWAMHATHLIVALDSSVGSWRRERYPAYKANRTASTAGWTNVFNHWLTQYDVAIVRVPTFEADDVLATFAARAEQSGRGAVILSGDSDLLQCASLLVRVVQFGRHPDPRYLPRSLEWIRTKYDLPTAGHLAAYKALVGERGDNLPGVPGVGPVKARKLLATATSLDDIPKLLSATEAEAYTLALDLVTLRADAPAPAILPSECRLAPLALAFGGALTNRDIR